jgi:undecaprenyl-diphosphatase
MDWFESLTLGAVQGLTEFLPISSDGHLTIVMHAFDWLRGRVGSGADHFFFVVMLHLGTLAAIIVFYRAAAWAGVRGLLGAGDVPPACRRGSVLKAGLLAAIATAPAVPVGLLFKKALEETFQSATAAAVGFLITAAVLGVTARLPGGEKGLDRTSWLDALLVGCAQALAPLPGVSRSGLTIAAGLGLGFSRSWAVGFSLLMAVPAILGAAVLELGPVVLKLKDIDAPTMTADRVAQVVTATVVAGLVGYAAITWLLRSVRSGRLWVFSVYLVLLATVTLILAQGGGHDVRQSATLDGSAWGGPGRSGAGADADRRLGPVDHPVAAGPRPGGADPGATAAGQLSAAGVVLGGPVAGRPAAEPGRPGSALGGGDPGRPGGGHRPGRT